MRLHRFASDKFARNTLVVAVTASLAVYAVVASLRSHSESVALERKSVATSMQTSVDGFGFPNFTASTTNEQFNTSDLQRMFGESVCVEGESNSCAPKAQAVAWAQMVNQARQTGHCEGFAVTAAWRYARHQVPSTASLANEGDVTHAIFRSFATQFFPSVQTEATSWANKTVVEKIASLSSELAAGRLTYSMGLYTDHGGHAVLPYALEFNDNDSVIVRVYDSNWPGRNRYVTIDLRTGKWTFSFSHPDPRQDPNPWTGDSTSMDLVSLTVRSSSPSPIGTGSVNDTMLLVRSPSKGWSVTTADGVIGPSSSTSSIKARIKPLHVDNSRQIPEYLVFVSSPTISLKLNDKSSVFIVRPNAVTRVTTSDSREQKIMIDESSITAGGDGVTLSLASEDLAVTITGAGAEIGVQDSSLTVSVGSEKLTVNAANPAVTFEETETGLSTRIGTEFDSVVPHISSDLEQKTEFPDLPPASARDMSVDGYQVDIYEPPARVKIVEAPPVSSSRSQGFIEASSTSTSSSTTVTVAPIGTTATTVVSTTLPTSTTTATSPPVPTGTSTTTTTSITTSVPTTTTTTTTSTTTTTTTTTTSVPTTTTTTTTSTTTTTTTTIAPTCATGGVCVVGDVGPGGGKVFYVAAQGAGFGWKYLEVAPTNAAVAIRWCNTNTSLLPGTFSRNIGTGAMNTSLILAASACTTGSAAAAADAYVSPNGTSDWFLPSILELLEMYPNRTLVGMPSSRNFWSSSQNSNIYAEARSFLDGGNPSWYKTNYIDYDVRAIRSFGVG